MCFLAELLIRLFGQEFARVGFVYEDVQCSVSFEPVVVFFCRVFGKLLLCSNGCFSAAASWAPRGVECVCMSWQNSAFLVYYEQWTC